MMKKMLMAERPSLSETFMTIAQVWSARSTCPQLHVGCVLVNRYNQVIASGYNGAPYNFPHCDEIGCGEPHLVIHAELNAIFQCSATGVSTRGAKLYCTHCPCLKCSLALIQAGIREVCFGYEPLEDSIKIMRRGGIIVRQI